VNTSISQDPLYRRIRGHAAKRIRFESKIPERAERMTAYRDFMDLEKKMIFRYHRKGDSGLRVARAGAIVIDVLIEELYHCTSCMLEENHPGKSPGMAIIALGGYGRGEMCPYSDVDLLLLNPWKKENQDISDFLEKFSAEILYPLWDLGLKVGHSICNIPQAMVEVEAESQSKNALLESRLICGSNPLFRRLLKEFKPHYRKGNPIAYMATQIDKQRQRRTKYGDSIYMQEPDIKNGVGGLRDYQNALWMCKIKYDESSLEPLVKHRILSQNRADEFRASYEFLLRVRNELHFMVKRSSDLLGLDRQPQVAMNLGYMDADTYRRVEAFMKDYYGHAKNILRTAHIVENHILRRKLPIAADRFGFRDAVEARRYRKMRKYDGFVLQDNWLSAGNSKVFEEDPIRLVGVFRLCQQHNALLHMDLETLIEDSLYLLQPDLLEDEELQRGFRSILQEAGNVYPILSKMHELGVLGKIVPEFGRLTCLVQHEFFHRYTADIHTLDTIKHLDQIFSTNEEPARSYLKALRKTEYPTMLYLILLLHDIGKADGVAGHDMRGAKMAKPILKRMGIPSTVWEKILFIIENHLEMARFSQRFDLDDPDTIRTFASLVRSQSRLCYLYVHTYCDARGTAESLWNSYKQSLHVMLFERTYHALAEDIDLDKEEQERRELMERELLAASVSDHISREEIDAHINLLPERYFAHNSLNEVELHLQMIHQLLSQIQNAESLGALAPIIDWKNNPEQGLTVINVVTWDRAGLFYKLAGALSVSNLNILSTKAITRSDHIAIDTFYVVDSDGGLVQDKSAKNAFEKHVEASLIHGEDLLPAIEKQAKKYQSSLFRRNPRVLPVTLEPTVNVYHELSLKRTIIEVQAADTLGLLFKLARIISEHQFDITFARISTENGIANDTFYIESLTDETTSQGNLLDLRQALSDVVEAEHRKLA